MMTKMDDMRAPRCPLYSLPEASRKQTMAAGSAEVRLTLFGSKSVVDMGKVKRLAVISSMRCRQSLCNHQMVVTVSVYLTVRRFKAFMPKMTHAGWKQSKSQSIGNTTLMACLVGDSTLMARPHRISTLMASDLILSHRGSMVTFSKLLT